MGATRYSKEVKSEVLSMGKSGKTYAEIRDKFPIPKSTLSVWFRNAGKKPDRARQLEHLKRAREMAVASIQQRKEERLALADENAGKELTRLSLQNKSVQKAFLAMLYWAEGSKTIPGLKFTNTDPVLLKLYLSLVRNCYSIDEKRIKIGLHIHHYHKPNEVLNFWSNLLAVPASQFWKIYVKKRSVQKRFRKNFRGICFIYYPSAAIQREVLALGQFIALGIDNALLSSFNG